MGGTTSPHYLRFRNLCSTAFSNLRKNANLILNLVALMVHSGVQDIKFEPDAAVGKVSFEDASRSLRSLSLFALVRASFESRMLTR